MSWQNNGHPPTMPVYALKRILSSQKLDRRDSLAEREGFELLVSSS